MIDTYNANRSEGDEYVAPPSVSFGVSMNYYKYPLNEAREEAEKNLLYGAKNIKGKDATVLTIRKGSGQQAKFAWKYGSPVQTEIKKFITDALSSTDPAEKTKALHSVIYHMRGEKRITQGLLYDETENAKSVYQIVIEDAARRGEEALGHAFDNLFDSDVQKQAGDYLEDIRKALLEFEKEENRAALEIVESQPYDLIVQMLWFAKFYTEKSGKEN